MVELISAIQSDADRKGKNDDEEIIEESEDDIETTSTFDIEQFNKWARSQATKDLSQFQHLTSICDIADFRSKISSLNSQ